MDIVARLKLSGQNFSAELGKTLGDAERKFGSTGSVIGRNLSEGIGGGLQNVASRVPALGGALTGLSGAALVTAAGLGAVALTFADGVAEAEGYEKALRQIDAALKATGNTTGLTRDQLVDFANDMEGSWATPAEEIMKAEQVLASFDGVAGAVFKRAIANAADLSAVYGGDLSSNSEKLGTVLQNLAQGEVTGLSKGFKFLGVETLNAIAHLAKMGDTAGAQEALLNALEESVGGTKGDTDGKGLSGAFFRLGDAVGDASREIATNSGLYGFLVKNVDNAANSVNELAEAYKNAETSGGRWAAIARFLAEATPGSTVPFTVDTSQPKPTPKPGPEKLGDDPYGLNGVLSLDGIIARSAADRAHASAEEQRKQEAAREAAESAAKKAATERQREAERTAAELERSLSSLREEYGSVASATWKYAEALAEIDRLQKSGRLGGAEVDRLKLNVLTAGMDPNGKLAAAVKAEFLRGPNDLRNLVENGSDQAGIVGTKMKAAVDEVANYWKEVNKAAVEDVADIMTDLIGGKAGRLIGDLFSLAGGGRANNPALALLTKGGSLLGKSGGAMDERGALGEVTGSVDKLDKGMRGIFGLSGEFTQSLGRMLAGASLGATAGGIVGGNSQASQFGAMAGGALGEKAGDMLGTTFSKQLGKLAGFAGPLGSIAGGVLGSVVGGLMSKVKWGASTVSFSNGELTAGDARGNSGRAKQAAEAGAGKVVTSLEGILEALGGTLLSAPSITIGTRHDDWRVNTSGTSLKIAKGAKEFDGDQQAAIEYAIQQMLAGAVIDGISEASKRILKDGSQDLDEAIQKAGLIEAIPKSLKARLDPVGAAIDDLNKKWEKTVAALREGGASAEQMAEAQKLYNMELADVKENTAAASATLRQFRDSLGLGSSSPLSLRDQEAAAKLALQPFLDKIDAGAGVDQSAFQTAAQSYLDIERQLYGSTGQFFAAFEQIKAATSKAIATVDNTVPISSAPPSDPFAEKTATATRASADLLSQMSNQMATQQATLDAIERALSSFGGGLAFIGSARNF
jgi:hypothetical protein